jgi:hypothetical protein
VIYRDFWPVNQNGPKIPKHEVMVVFDADMVAKPNFFTKVREFVCVFGRGGLVEGLAGRRHALSGLGWFEILRIFTAQAALVAAEQIARLPAPQRAHCGRPP